MTNHLGNDSRLLGQKAIDLFVQDPRIHIDIVTMWKLDSYLIKDLKKSILVHCTGADVSDIAKAHFRALRKYARPSFVAIL